MCGLSNQVVSTDYHSIATGDTVPILLLPKKRLPLVEDEGGGGFWICEAVGARDWRIEYVRCIFADVVGCDYYDGGDGCK